MKYNGHILNKAGLSILDPGEGECMTDGLMGVGKISQFLCAAGTDLLEHLQRQRSVFGHPLAFLSGLQAQLVGLHLQRGHPLLTHKGDRSLRFNTRLLTLSFKHWPK